MSFAKNILLVEDSAEDIELTRRAFRINQVTESITVVRDGAEALDFLFGNGAYLGRDLSHVPTVILLDLKLPKVSGLEVLGQIRRDQRTAEIPVVILTSSTNEQDLKESYRLRANSYVHKPVDFKKFLETARVLAAYWLQINTLPADKCNEHN